MAQKKTVNLKALRAALNTEIGVMQQTVHEGASAVKNAKSTGKKSLTAKNQKSLAHARKVLATLKRQESALASYCCDFQTQNCDFSFE